MKQNLRNIGFNAPASHFGLFSAEKKKTIIAVCLIAVMALMWARLLGRKTPRSAGAATTQGAINPDAYGSNSESEVFFQELPCVEGRNDVLTRDFFASDDWKTFLRDREGYTQKVSVVSEDGDEEVVKRIAGKLKLQAIWLDKNPQAFINDKLLSLGDKLVVTEGAETYECEVVGIDQNKVFVRCGNAKITLRLTHATGIAD